VREVVGEDRAEDGDADRAADLAEERRAGACDAQVLVVDRVLGDQHEHLQHEAQPEPEDEQVCGSDQGRRPDVQPREEKQADRHDRGTGDRERLVAAEAADQLPAADGRDEEARHHRGEQQAGRGRAVALDVLEVERDVGDGAEEREADDEPDRAADAKDAVAEELERQDGLGRALLGEDERNEQEEPGGNEGEHRRRPPRVGGAPEARVEHDRGKAACKQRRPEEVDRVLGLVGA
jgi:hypothetical protein